MAPAGSSHTHTFTVPYLPEIFRPQIPHAESDFIQAYIIYKHTIVPMYLARQKIQKHCQSYNQRINLKYRETKISISLMESGIQQGLFKKESLIVIKM